jgi:hypothetical protein
VLPTGKLRIEPATVVDEALLVALKKQRDEIIAELRRRERNGDKAALPNRDRSQPVGAPGERRPDLPIIGDPVLVSARLLRECRWAVAPPVCSFLIGRPGERCQRCGASWHEHYPT